MEKKNNFSWLLKAGEDLFCVLISHRTISGAAGSHPWTEKVRVDESCKCQVKGQRSLSKKVQVWGEKVLGYPKLSKKSFGQKLKSFWIYLIKNNIPHLANTQIMKEMRLKIQGSVFLCKKSRKIKGVACLHSFCRLFSLSKEARGKRWYREKSFMFVEFYLQMGANDSIYLWV